MPATIRVTGITKAIKKQGRKTTIDMLCALRRMMISGAAIRIEIPLDIA